jgi:hypothetical protein
LVRSKLGVGLLARPRRGHPLQVRARLFSLGPVVGSSLVLTFFEKEFWPNLTSDLAGVPDAP